MSRESPRGSGAGRAAPALRLLSLMWAGESIYLLPYALRRDYAGALIDALKLPGEAELGALYSFFGALSLVAYVAGGWVADRARPRTLLTASLLLTAASGAWLASFPTSAGARYGLFALWSVSTIFLFWAALIKATRRWGGGTAQGRAFGALDGGRGLVAAAIASLGLQLFAALGGGAAGLRGVIGLYAGACLVGAVAIAAALTGAGEQPAEPAATSTASSTGSSTGGTRQLFGETLRRPRTWLLGGIIACAYAGYLGTFYFAGFAAAAFDQEQAGAAAVSVFSLWLRAPVAILAGVLADRVRARTVVLGAFALLVVGFGSLALVPAGASGLSLLYFQAGVAAAGTYALRAVFYALMAEGGLPAHLTGTTVGVVSFVGYLPDVLTPYLWGRLLDAQPGAAGYHFLFGSLALASVAGGVFAALHRPAPAAPTPEGE